MARVADDFPELVPIDDGMTDEERAPGSGGTASGKPLKWLTWG
jgi:hypothetical protein